MSLAMRSKKASLFHGMILTVVEFPAKRASQITFVVKLVTRNSQLKFIYSEKATKFCKIFP